LLVEVSALPSALNLEKKKVPAGQSSSSCALAEEAKTPSVASATIASMAVSISITAIEYCLVVVTLLTTASLLTDVRRGIV
jgi:predicted cobalt transporter CbtA